MYCKNCGQQIDNNAAVCIHCGVAVGNGANFCPNCGNSTMPGAAVCTKCGYSIMPQTGDKSRLTAGLLGIFLGGIGIHNFYLGFTGKAIAQIAVSIVTFGVGSLCGFIEGILILCGSINKDANGKPLRD